MQSSGILPSQSIAALAAGGIIRMDRPLDTDQIQPASLDLRLGTRAYRMRASFLPGPRTRVAELRQMQRRMGLVSTPDPDISGGVALSVDLGGFGDGVVGYRAKRHTGVVDVDKRAACELLDFWEPIAGRGRNELILDPNEFYI